LWPMLAYLLQTSTWLLRSYVITSHGVRKRRLRSKARSRQSTNHVFNEMQIPMFKGEATNHVVIITPPHRVCWPAPSARLETNPSRSDGKDLAGGEWGELSPDSAIAPCVIIARCHSNRRRQRRPARSAWSSGSSHVVVRQGQGPVVILLIKP
jgi:hypothetical protein